MAMTSSAALAVGPGKILQFNSNQEDIVVFDGTTHKEAGLACADCHNKEIFPEMKLGSLKITKKDLLAGKFCGKCHDGSKAFAIKNNCFRCHAVPGA